MSQTLSLGSWFLARHKQMQSRWLSNIQLLGSAHIYWLWAPFGHWVMGFHTAFFFSSSLLILTIVGGLQEANDFPKVSQQLCGGPRSA